MISEILIRIILLFIFSKIVYYYPGLKKYNKTVTKNVLLDKSYEIDKEINSNSLEVSLHRLRKILEKSESALEIKNLRGIGYIIS